jgi:hypothetical protein
MGVKEIKTTNGSLSNQKASIASNGESYSGEMALIELELALSEFSIKAVKMEVIGRKYYRNAVITVQFRDLQSASAFVQKIAESDLPWVQNSDNHVTFCKWRDPLTKRRAMLEKTNL